jgi:cellulose synthase (UDP-forming)
MVFQKLNRAKIMSRILRFLLEKPVAIVIERRYQHYCQNGTSFLVASAATMIWVMCWIFLKMESEQWQQVHANSKKWFPHISLDHPRIGDMMRCLIQAIWLIVFVQRKSNNLGKYVNYINQIRKKYLNLYRGYTTTLFEQIGANSLFANTVANLKQNKISSIIFYLVMYFCLFSLLLLCITQPFTPQSQSIFMLLLLLVALGIRHIEGHFIVIMLVILSVIVSTRYLWWRYSYTLIWHDTVSAFFGILLISAETYIFFVLLLGYLQTIWPLHRKPVALPSDIGAWPTIDILIPTYNEELEILKPGVFAALGLDWPKDKINIYILDDGKRKCVKEFAESVGVHYIARPTNEHAKAGNINYALKQTQGEFVVIFDCDHIPAHVFLQLTIGWFIKEPKLAILQTPHHFFSPDPFERNLDTFQYVPNESSLFYGLVQDGNDLWDATYFCGSAGILRRSALESIGGFALESVTEDALTSIRLQREGYTSAYIRIPMVAGLATESLSRHIGQRIRWARGMAQILRIDNPLTGKGLRLGQRLCYFNAILHFLSGIPRLIFFVSPVAFLALHARFVNASALMLLLYAFPHIVHAAITNSRIQGKYRHFLWNEIYETVIAWYIAVPTTMALINPRKGTFNVTDKGGLIEKSYADWNTARPYFILLAINAIGFIAAIWRLFYGPADEISSVLITLVWVIYNLAILGGALGVDVEAKQIRKSARVKFVMPAAIARADGHLFPCTIQNYSDNGVGIELHTEHALRHSEDIMLLLKKGVYEFPFPCKVIRIFDKEIGVRLGELTREQHIDFMLCTFARADIWALWQNKIPEDRPLDSIRNVFMLDFRGYLSIINYAPLFIRRILARIIRMLMWLGSFLPHPIKN